MPDEPDPEPPTCGWCRVPLIPLGSDAMPYWQCPHCDEVSLSV